VKIPPERRSSARQTEVTQASLRASAHPRSYHSNLSAAIGSIATPSPPGIARSPRHEPGEARRRGDDLRAKSARPAVVRPPAAGGDDAPAAPTTPPTRPSQRLGQKLGEICRASPQSPIRMPISRVPLSDAHQHDVMMRCPDQEPTPPRSTPTARSECRHLAVALAPPAGADREASSALPTSRWRSRKRAPSTAPGPSRPAPTHRDVHHASEVSCPARAPAARGSSSRATPRVVVVLPHRALAFFSSTPMTRRARS